MTITSGAFINALLADAAYVGGLTSSSVLSAALSPRMTPTLAEYIGANFTVVTQIVSDAVSGSSFDATVWRRISDGKIFLSTRGTQQAMDFLVDGDLAINGAAREQIADMVNWWLKISTAAGEPAPQIQRLFPEVPGANGQIQYFRFVAPTTGTGQVVGATNIEVDGHSLGGHLATAFARIFGGSTAISHITTFNSAGFTGSSEVVFQNLQTMLGMGTSRFPSTAEQTNYFAKNGLNFTTNSFYFNQQGQRVEISNESDATQLGNHYMYKLTDVLALCVALEKLDTTLTIAKLNTFFDAGSNRTQASVESVLDGLRKVFGGTGITATPVGDVDGSAASRATYHATLAELQNSQVFKDFSGKLSIKTASVDLRAQARNDFSALVALQDLSPVVFSGKDGAADAQLAAVWQSTRAADYAGWTADKSTLTPSNFTDQWLADRAVLLQAIVTRNNQDNTTGLVYDVKAPGGRASVLEYQDSAGQQTLITLKEGGAGLPEQHFVFGGAADDALTGTNNVLGDHLYGGGGDDSIDGKSGDDYLEGNIGNDTLDGGAGNDKLLGGAGTDTYQFTGTIGSDTVTDSDGNGTIVVAGTTLTGGVKVALNVWESGDKKVFYTVMGDNLVIGQRADAGAPAAKGSITVTGWNAMGGNHLGITLDSADPPAPVTQHAFNGDIAKKVTGSVYTLDTDGNYLSDGAETNAQDILVGTTEADSINGAGGNDGVNGGAGSDSIEGGLGDDLLMGGPGQDTLNGGSGNDIILGSANGAMWHPLSTEFTPQASLGVDYSRGFSWIASKATSEINYVIDGANILPEVETTGNFIDAGPGNDRIGAGTGDDIAYGGEGNDTVRGMAGSDILFGDDGDDLVAGDGFQGAHEWSTQPGEHGADYLDGGAGNDVMGGQGGGDIVYGGTGNDLMYGDDEDFVATPVAVHGSDYLDGEAGDDTLIGGGKDDTLYGGDGNDLLGGDAGDVPASNHSFIAGASNGNDFMDGEGGDDRMVGDGGNDEMYGGAGNDSLNGDGFELAGADQGNDTLDGEDGNDLLTGNGGSDELYGGTGNDTLNGDDSSVAASYNGRDYLDGEAGDDSLIGGGAEDTLIGGDGNDKLFGDGDFVGAAQQAADELDGGAGDDTLRGYGGNDTMGGGDGNDLALGDDGNDCLTGGNGNDQLQGGAGDDVINGDAGNDLLVGDAGDDVIDAGAGNNELQGGDGQDMLQGGAGNDTVFGGAGNDLIDGGGGNDTLQGGEGDDTMAGDGQGQMLGEAGNDVLTAYGSNTIVMDGGAGDDWLAGASLMFGGLGNDTLVGSGNTAYGGAGDDTYVIADAAGYTWVNDSEGANTLQLTGATPGAGGVTLDTVVPGDMNNLRLQVGALTVDTMGLLSGVTANVQISGRTYAGGELFGQAFAGSMSQTSSAAGAKLQGGTLADTFTSTGGGATLAGGAGADTLIGSGGNNTYRFYVGDGSDTLTDAGGGTLAFGAGLTSSAVQLSVDAAGAMVLSFTGNTANSSDAIHLTGFNANNAAQSTGIASYQFADGTVLTQAQLVARGFDIIGTAGSDTLTGTNLADRIAGGAGADTLTGKAGADDYSFNLGDGADLVADADATLGTGDTLHLGTGIAPANIFGLRSGNDVTLQVGGTSDQITLKSYFAGGAAAADTVERIVFADGTEWTQADVTAAVAKGGQIGWTLTGTVGDDSLTGAGGPDLLTGLAGNDTLAGGAGDDTLNGGADGDTLRGGVGNDLYLAGLNDTIDETGGDAGATDVARFDFASTSVYLSSPLSGTDLLMNGAGVLVPSQFTTLGAANGIERFEFSDGVTLSAQQVLDRVNTGSGNRDEFYGTVLSESISGKYGADYLNGNGGNDTMHGDAGDDQLSGDSGDDLLFGDEGEDTLSGSLGNDTLNGGAGWDRLDGGAGNDTYTLAAGQSMEIITADASGTDRVLLGAGITPANVTLYRVSSPAAADLNFKADSLVVQLNGSGDQVWISNYFDATTPGYIETIQFADSTSWDYATVQTRLVTKGGTVNTVTGTTKADAFTVDHWNDVINDTTTTDIDSISASVSYKVPANVNNLTLAGTLDLFPVAGATSGTLTGNAADNRFELTPGAGFQTMAGGAGNDTYVLRLTTETVTPGYDPANGVAAANIVEAAGAGTDTLLSGYWSSTLPANVDNLVLTRPNGWYTSGLFQYYTNQPNDYTHKYIGNDANNVIDASQYEYWIIYQNWMNKTKQYPTLVEFQLDGGPGADTLVGGQYNDTFILDSTADVVVETGVNTSGIDTSIDTVAYTGSSGTLRLTAFDHVENLRIDSAATGVNGEGNAAANVITGGVGVNTLWGLAGNDTLLDHPSSVAASDTDLLDGGAGNDTLISWGGVDTLDGGAGDDTYRVEGSGRSAVLRLGLGDGHDSLTQDVGLTSTITVELKGSLGLADVQMTRASGQYTFTLADGSSLTLRDTNTVSLHLGDGTSFGPAELDILMRTSDRTTATELADLLYGSAGDDSIASLGGNDIVYGAAGNDVIAGGAGDDTLNGGAGNDTLTGGAGADVYRFGRGLGSDTIDDISTTGASGSDDGAIDTVAFDASVLVADVQLSQVMVAGVPSAILLTLPATGDTLLLQREYAASGAVEQISFADGTLWNLVTIKSRITGTIGSESADTITAPATSYRLEGRGGNDTLTGGAGNDTLDGGTGADKMTGGAGNDSYTVDSLADQVIEASTGGTADAVIVSVDAYLLPAQVERGQLAAGSSPWSLSGNTLANALTGNAGNNRLDGGTGIDTLTGGAGDDTYVVDVATDVIIEAAGEGTDSVEALSSYTLPTNVENLRLTGTATKLVATGNAGDNILIGNSVANTLSGLAGNDTLDGGAGNDAMTGGAGNDTYVVDATGDTTVEAAAGGVDTVQTGLTWILASEVERLTLTGTTAVNGTGNASLNWLAGNSANNVLNGLAGADVMLGGAGNDTLQDTAGNGAFDGGAGNDVLIAGAGNDLLAGGAGNDTLTLGAGSDIVAFNLGDGVDTINAPTSGAGLGEANDVLSLGHIRLGSVTLSHEANDLVLRVTGTGDALRIASWYAATGDQTFTKLQVAIDSTADYAPGTGDALYSSRVDVLDFKQLVAAYDSARVSNPALVNWAPSAVQLQSARLSASDSLAYGGHLAYRYAEDGSFGGVQYETGTPELVAVGFGSALQDILLG